MLYIKRQLSNNIYSVYDTDDGSENKLDTKSILELNKHFKILGVSDNTIKPVDPFKLYNKWRLLGVLDRKLNGISVGNFFGEILPHITISKTTDKDLTLLRHKFSGIFEMDSITIPNGVECIPSFFFENSKNLQSVVMPDSIKYLGSGTFLNCKLLESIKFSNSLKKITYNCFNSCTSLKKIEIPEGVTILDGWCFSYCSNLQDVKLPKSLKAIGPYAFCKCYSLIEIKIPDNIEFINSNSFYDCNNLETIYLPKSFKQDLYSIMSNRCTNLKQIIVGDEIYPIIKGNISLR